MEDSIFTKIINGEIPSHKVFEDDLTLAIMDIHPIQYGHVTVIAKKQIENFYDLPDEDYSALIATVKKIAEKLHEVFPDKNKIAVQIEGFEVPHVHVKVFPMNMPADFHNQPDKDVVADQDELARLAQKLKI